MILAYHIILSMYGFWLPNDPRGSWSDFVRAWELFRYGPATKVNTRSSVAGAPHDRALRAAAKAALKYSPVQFSGQQARAAAVGFSDAAREAGYAIHACAVLHDHVHLVVGHHARHIDRMISHLKSKATMRLTAEGLHPFSEYRNPNGYTPSPWAAKGWKVFIDSTSHLRSAMAYVERNPVKEGLSPQRWKFVVPTANENRGKPRR